MNNNSNIKMAHFYTFLLLSLVLFLFESFIPRPLPWLKLGLANLMVVSSFTFFKPSETFKLVVYRILIGAIFLGTIGSPTFLMSLGGGILAWLAMYVIFRFHTSNLVTVSIHGGVFHYLGQVGIAYFLFLKNEVIFYLLPYLIIGGMISGFIIGILARKFSQMLKIKLQEEEIKLHQEKI